MNLLTNFVDNYTLIHLTRLTSKAIRCSQIMRFIERLQSSWWLTLKRKIDWWWNKNEVNCKNKLLDKRMFSKKKYTLLVQFARFPTLTVFFKRLLRYTSIICKLHVHNLHVYLPWQDQYLKLFSHNKLLDPLHFSISYIVQQTHAIFILRTFNFIF